MPHQFVLNARDDGRPPLPDRIASDDPPPAFDEIPGHNEFHGWHGIRIHCRRLGGNSPQPPLVLVHMADVGASCLEWRRNIAGLAHVFDTYAVDLPGFGLSGVPEDAPRAALYLQFLLDFLTRVQSEHGQAPCAVGSGAGAAYLAAVAQSHPGVLSRMALVAPTGLSACKPNRFGAVAFHALRLPVVSSITSSAASRVGILEHLKQEVYGDDTLAGMSEADARYFVAHRPGVEAVERARVAGLLNVNLRPIIAGIRTPTFVAWGRRAASPPADDAEVWRELNPSTIVGIFEKSGLCPHLEEPARFNETATAFLTMGKPEAVH